MTGLVIPTYSLSNWPCAGWPQLQTPAISCYQVHCFELVAYLHIYTDMYTHMHELWKVLQRCMQHFPEARWTFEAFRIWGTWGASACRSQSPSSAAVYSRSYFTRGMVIPPCTGIIEGSYKVFVKGLLGGI